MRGMERRVWRPERRGGASSPQSQYVKTGLATRTTRGRVVSTFRSIFPTSDVMG